MSSSTADMMSDDGEADDSKKVYALHSRELSGSDDAHTAKQLYSKSIEHDENAGANLSSVNTLNDDGRSRNLYSVNTNDTNNSLGKIYTSGNNQEYLYIGRQKFLKDDLYEAFGGTLNPGLAPESKHKFGNPAPLGLSAFAMTTFILSMFNVGARGIEVPNVFVASAMSYGGLIQLLAGLWEIALENTFGGTALCSFGGFWLSYGSVFIPWFGIQEAYKDNQADLSNALGIMLVGWAIFTMGVTFCTLKSTVMFFSLYFFLTVTFVLLAACEFTGNVAVRKTAGVVGIVVSFIAWYNAYAGLATRQNTYFLTHPVRLPANERTFF